MPSLVTRRAGAVPRSGAVASVHALRIAQGRLAVLTHVALGADTDLVLIADALVGALFVTLWIGSFKLVFVQFVSLRLVRFEHGVNHIVFVWVGVDVFVCDWTRIRNQWRSDHVVPFKVRKDWGEGFGLTRDF